MSEHIGSGKGRIVVDWDDTCVENSWPEMGWWLPHAVEALKIMSEQAEVVIFSTRLASHNADEVTPNPERQAKEYARMRTMLDEAGLQKVRIWDKPWKPGAEVYIDDKAVRFDGNWQYTLMEIEDVTAFVF